MADDVLNGHAVDPIVNGVFQRVTFRLGQDPIVVGVKIASINVQEVRQQDLSTEPGI
jgi:hypothetical protein